MPRLTRRATAERRSRLGVLAIALVVAVLGSGCGGSGDGEAATTTTSAKPVTTTTSVPQDDTEAVIDAYVAAELAGIKAGIVPDPEHPDIARTHTGPMLQQTREVLRGYQLRKLALRYPDPIESGFRITVEPEAVELTMDTAVFDACAVDEGERINTETGEYDSSNDGPDTFLLRVGMRFEDGVWKLAERRELESWQGVAGCAA